MQGAGIARPAFLRTRIDKSELESVNSKVIVNLGKPMYRTVVAALVCILAVGVFTLAQRAKCSQYQSGHAASNYLSQAIKMSEDRCQRAGDVAPAAVAAIPHRIAASPARPVPARPAAAEPLPLKRIDFHASLWFRPPPSAG